MRSSVESVNELKLLFARMGGRKGTGQRLGQFFVNRYLKKDDRTTKPLFYLEDDELALDLIRQWLVNNHHTDKLPQPVPGNP